ncbi:MAG: M43 family zinc metalloprotease [Cytophagales bacterium]|nr:M43 family zinc metalloprotease [Cytophagales bacterium]
MRILIYLIFLTCTLVVKSQHVSRRVNKVFNLSQSAPHRNCYTMQNDSIMRLKYRLPSAGDFEKELGRLQKLGATMRTGTDTVIIPYIVHVVHRNEAVGTGANISAAQVYSQIEVLNEDFNRKPGTRGYNTSTVGSSLIVWFKPALTKPNGTLLVEPGINRVNFSKNELENDDIEITLKPSTIYDPTRYLNMWTVRFGGDMDGTLGYAQFPSLSKLSGLQTNEGAANTDGVVIGFQYFGRVGNVVSPYNLGRTTTHELGHFFGLRHVWGDKSNCKGTDYCDDTPKTTDPHYGCTANQTSCTAGVRAMIENYMDYSDDGCMNIFTANQVSRMNTVLTNSPRRAELISSKVYMSGNKPKADFVSNVSNACPTSNISFYDLSTKTPTGWNWTVYSSTSSIVIHTSSSQNFNYTFNNTGKYSIRLIVQNTDGKDTLRKNNYINISASSTLALPYFENFEGSTWLNDWVYLNPNNDLTEWYAINGQNAFGTGAGNSCMYIDNYGDSTDLSGTTDLLISPAINFQTYQNAYLSFDIAYSMYKDGTNTWADTLVLCYTTACGTGLTEIWRKGGAELATISYADTSYFDPLGNQWRREQIPLSILNGKNNISIVLKNVSGWGNALYLDNFRIFVGTVSSVPTAHININPATICGGGTVTLSDSSTQYPQAWQWRVQHASNPSILFTSNLHKLALTLSVAGYYNVTLSSTNAQGSSQPLVKNNGIRVLPAPAVAVSCTDTDLIICEQTVTISGTGAQEYLWFDVRSQTYISDDAQLVTAPVDTVKYILEGYAQSGYITCFNASSIQLSYYCAPATVPGSNTTPGVYTLPGVNTSAGINTTPGMNTTTGMTYDENAVSISIYPNPVTGRLVIETDVKIFIPDYFILYDLYGKELLRHWLTSEYEIINLEHISSGWYMYHYLGEHGRLIKN